MIRCLDIHTHHAAPQPQAVVSAKFEEFQPLAGQLYSIGIHPWDSQTPRSSELWAEFEKLATLPCVAAIGECGIDKPKGGFMFRQVNVFHRQIEISERLQKPMIIHDVKAHDVIVGLRKEPEVTQKWVVHGFRGKPTVAKMLTDAGIYISFGENFNPDTPAIVPPHMMLAETDESALTIEEIILRLSENLGHDVTAQIAANTAEFLNLPLEEFNG